MKYKDVRQDKGFAHKKANKPNPDSITKVHFSHSKNIHEPYKNLACYTNNRQPCTARCDKGLWNAFVSTAKSKYGSVCRAIEIFAAAVVDQDKEKVHICNTINQMNLNQTVVREMRPRRKLVVDDVEEEVEEPSCAFCSNHAVVRAELLSSPGSKLWLCEMHYQQKHVRVRVLERVEEAGF